MTRPTNIVLEPELRAAAKRRAAKLGISMSAYIRDLIREDEARSSTPAGDISLIAGILGDGGGPTDMSRDKHRLIDEAFADLRDRRLGIHDDG